jgi:hypothetical protein
MADDDRARRRRIGRESLEAPRSAHPVCGEPAHLLCDVGHHGSDRVVVAGLDPHDARRLGRPKAHREHGPEHDRDLAEDVAGVTLPDDALDSVDVPDRLDPPLEHGEERALVARVRRVLARHEADVGRHTRELLTLSQVEPCEEGDATDLVGRHHAGRR